MLSIAASERTAFWRLGPELAFPDIKSASVIMKGGPRRSLAGKIVQRSISYALARLRVFLFASGTYLWLCATGSPWGMVWGHERTRGATASAAVIAGRDIAHAIPYCRVRDDKMKMRHSKARA